MSLDVRLCTWNIQLGLRLGLILEAMRRHADFRELDVLALQEASIHDNVQDARRIAEALGPQYECYQVTAHFLAGRAQANALVWHTGRVQIALQQSLRLPFAHESPLSRSEHALLRHLPRQERNSLMMEGSIGGESMRIYSAHLDVIGFAHKRLQLRHLLDDARSRPPVSLSVIAGDLNTFRIRTPPTWAQLIADARKEGFEDVTAGIGWTHAVRELRMRQKLDSILVRRQSSLRPRAWTLDIAGSDHIPVFADLLLE